jgi:hypothetical protein
MRNKRFLVLGIALVLLAMVAGVAFAGTDVAFQIINADTFEVISQGTLTANLNNTGGNRAAIKRSIRSQLGFPQNSDERTVSGVKQRILWLSFVGN